MARTGECRIAGAQSPPLWNRRRNWAIVSSNRRKPMSSTLFQRVEPVSKKTRVVASLKEAILSGAVQSGDQIVEGKIAEQLGVGQGLIREALIELEHQGFVTRTPFSGTQVNKLSS